MSEKRAVEMKLQKAIAGLLIGLGFLAVSGCVKMTLAWTDLRAAGPEAAPPVLASFDGAGPVASVDQWTSSRAPALRAALSEEIYGQLPDDYQLNILDRRVLDDGAFGGAGALVEYQLQADVRFGGEVRQTSPFYMNVVTPASKPDAPIILMQTFCARWDALPHPDVTRVDGVNGCDGGGAASGLMFYVFGRYIATPPVEMILARGYGIAAIFPGEFVPDRRTEGLEALAALSPGLGRDQQRWGAIAAWGWGFSLMVDALEHEDARDGGDYIAWGHSRYGKAALVAAAYDERISGVIAHQSGTGGASLNRQKKGESVKAITENYPHWFAEKYAAMAGREEDMSVDQHHLLALIAPRPVLLGNARRDVWSDPNGAFRAALGADPVYELFGEVGLDQDRLDDWTPDADIAFWIRPGTHGVVKEDWPAFLEFLEAHFPIGARIASR